MRCSVAIFLAIGTALVLSPAGPCREGGAEHVMTRLLLKQFGVENLGEALPSVQEIDNGKVSIKGGIGNYNMEGFLGRNANDIRRQIADNFSRSWKTCCRITDLALSELKGVDLEEKDIYSGLYSTEHGCDLDTKKWRRALWFVGSRDWVVGFDLEGSQACHGKILAIAPFVYGTSKGGHEHWLFCFSPQNQDLYGFSVKVQSIFGVRYWGPQASFVVDLRLKAGSDGMSKDRVHSLTTNFRKAMELSSSSELSEALASVASKDRIIDISKGALMQLFQRRLRQHEIPAETLSCELRLVRTGEWYEAQFGKPKDSR